MARGAEIYTGKREMVLGFGLGLGIWFGSVGFGFGRDVAIGAAAAAAAAAATAALLLMMMMTNKTMESKRLMAFVCKMNECGNVSCFHLQRHLLC